MTVFFATCLLPLVLLLMCWAWRRCTIAERFEPVWVGVGEGGVEGEIGGVEGGGPQCQEDIYYGR